MPRITGLSHVFAAVLVLFLAPVLKTFVGLLVSKEDFRRAITAAGQTLSNHPLISLETELVTTVIYLSILFVGVFVYGFAIHVKRHGYD